MWRREELGHQQIQGLPDAEAWNQNGQRATEAPPPSIATAVHQFLNEWRTFSPVAQTLSWQESPPPPENMAKELPPRHSPFLFELHVGSFDLLIDTQRSPDTREKRKNNTGGWINKSNKFVEKVGVRSTPTFLWALPPPLCLWPKVRRKKKSPMTSWSYSNTQVPACCVWCYISLLLREKNDSDFNWVVGESSCVVVRRLL